SRFRPGDRVVAVSIQGCMACPQCRMGMTNLCPHRQIMGLSHDGGMAEFAVVREEHLIPVPQSMAPEVAALVEPVSVAVRAAARARLGPGDTVVVSGPGPIGLFCALVARRWGAHVVVTGVDRDEALRLEAVRRHGLTAVNVEQVPLREALGRRPNRWIEAAGSTAALASAFDSLTAGGRLVVV